ncbi:MAG: hypothetical protein AB7O80_23190 [Acetobacteraceae bacterium]
MSTPQSHTVVEDHDMVDQVDDSDDLDAMSGIVFCGVASLLVWVILGWALWRW